MLNTNNSLIKLDIRVILIQAINLLFIPQNTDNTIESSLEKEINDKVDKKRRMSEYDIV